MITKVISGGQTGVDQMALQVGKELGITTGGTAPPNYWTEQGSNYSLREFGLREIDREKQFTRSPKAIYIPRTYTNVWNSDGTVYFNSNSSSKGLRVTENACRQSMKPFIVNPSVEQLKA